MEHCILRAGRIALCITEGAGEDLVAFKGKLRAEIQEELNAEILKGIDYPTLPPGLPDFIDSGAKMHGKQTGWFDIIVLKFADLLKMPENAEFLVAYQNRSSDRYQNRYRIAHAGSEDCDR